ncbi:hypothetical protein L6R53_28130 [Myxococcota bacterium]|nr:hypothetical protein [Myxococcota bacterium]
MRSISSDSDEARAAAELRAALAPVWRARAGRARARMQAVRAAARVATPALARAEEARELSRWWSAQVRAAEQEEESLDLHPLDLPLSAIQLAVLPPPDPSLDPVLDSSVDPTIPVDGEGAAVMEGPVFQEGLMLGGLKSWMYEDEAMVVDGATTETGTETGTDTETGVEKDPAETLQTRFGAGAWQVQDAVALGVSVARQFGTRDLLWDHLVAWDDPLRRTPVPADEDELTTLHPGRSAARPGHQRRALRRSAGQRLAPGLAAAFHLPDAGRGLRADPGQRR